MKRSSIIEVRRQSVSPEVRSRVDLSIQTVDRLHAIITDQGLQEKDLAGMADDQVPKLNIRKSPFADCEAILKNEDIVHKYRG